MDWTFLQRCIIAGLCILFSGCTVWDNALRTTRYEPSLFSYKHDRRRSLAVYRRWADEAWQQQWQAAPELGDRPAYGQGFRDGFVDYTFAGGTGEPPAVPPRKLWNVFYRNEEGHQSTADWFAGYRHGARISRDGGYRSLSTLRSSLFGYPDGAGNGGYSTPEAAPGYGGQPYVVPDDVDTLPAPTTLPPPDRPDAINNERPSAEPADAAPPSEFQDVEPAPPPPQELPPATPSEIDLPEMEESDDEFSLELEDSARVPAATPAAEPASNEAGTGIERIQLSMPEKSISLATPVEESAERSRTSSLRIINAPVVAGISQQMRPVAVTPKLVRTPLAAQGKKTRPVGTAIRLTSASVVAVPTSETKPVSTIKIHQDGNTLRDRTSVGSKPLNSPFTR